jgi:aryl-alcohol dehydrogenase-like predicted oxidoreductase
MAEAGDGSRAATFGRFRAGGPSWCPAAGVARYAGSPARRRATAATAAQSFVSNYSPAQIAEFSAVLPVETAQPPYHLFRRDIEDDLLPYCRVQNIGVLVYGPLAHGLLTGTLHEYDVRR